MRNGELAALEVQMTRVENNFARNSGQERVCERERERRRTGRGCGRGRGSRLCCNTLYSSAKRRSLLHEVQKSEVGIIRDIND